MEIDELLEQIAIAEDELKELQGDLQEYDPDDLDTRDEYNEIRVDIQGVERNLESLKEQLKTEHNVMTALEFKTWLDSFSHPYRFCSIRHLNSDSIGVALIVGEGLGGSWGSGSFIVHWTNGESTTIDDDDYIQIVNKDIIGHFTDEDGNEIEDA